MKKALLLLPLFLSALSAAAQDYSTIVNHYAVPLRPYGAPLFARADSTASAARLLPTGQQVFIISRQGPWYRVAYGEPSASFYAVASSLVIPGQPGHETPQPCADANAMLVYSADAPADAWRKACQSLLGSGYGLARKDADLYSFSTEPKALGKTMKLTVTGFVQPGPDGKGSIVTFSGNYSYLAVTSGGLYQINTNEATRPAAFKGGPHQSDRIAFAAVDQAARAYPGAAIKYGLR